MKLNKTAQKWLRTNEACEPGYKWAARECANIREVLATANPDWAIWTYLRPGILTEREQWEFALDCAERALPHFTAWAPNDNRPAEAIRIKRLHLEGKATDAELDAAWAAAGDAARAAARAAWAARDAAGDDGAAAWDAGDAARAAARAAWAARDAAGDDGAAGDAARAAARAAGDAAWTAGAAAWAARPAEELKQAQWLRENTKPTLPDEAQQPETAGEEG
jgi:hypothetical protein